MLITRESIKNNPQLLVKIINNWYASPDYLEMLVSDSYYRGENIEISKRRKMMQLYEDVDRVVQGEGGDSCYLESIPYIREDLSRANHKLSHKFHFELVNQCKNYLCGNPVRVSMDEDENPENVRDEILRIVEKDNDWAIFCQENIKNAQKYKWSWSRVLIDDQGRFKFKIVDPKEIISFWDDFDNLTLLIRVYKTQEYDKNGDILIKEFAEVYDSSFKDVYIKDSWIKNGLNSYGYSIDQENVSLMSQKYDYSAGDDLSENLKIDLNWGQIPFVRWRFNEDDLDALKPIKCFIDILDLNVSDLANNIDDVQDVVWILENYQGQSISEFLKDLKIRKALSLGEGGKAHAEKVEIPVEARMKLYEICRRNIYKFGRGVDFTDRDNRGNQTGVGLKWPYGALDEKADELENQGCKALLDIFRLLFKYLDANNIFKSKTMPDIDFVFDRTLLVNEAERADIAINAQLLISNRAAIENHPFTRDIEEELERIEEERGLNEQRRIKSDKMAAENLGTNSLENTNEQL